LESDRFKQCLDHLPIAIAVSEREPQERIVYANPEFLNLIGAAADWPGGQDWSILVGRSCDVDGIPLGEAVTRSSDFIGQFEISHSGEPIHLVNAWSNLIHDDDGTELFRLVALINQGPGAESEQLEQRLREKDMLLLELQHRVKNNLQMITALIRLESRQVSDLQDEVVFDRLAGRIEALALLYRALTAEDQTGEVDLGSYLGQIASAAMQAQAVEGVRLEMKMDSWPVSVNIAMPAGLVVNEILTNSLKYAFRERSAGTISLHCIVDDATCKVVVADDGVGLPAQVQWPEPGKISALMVRTLRENAHAQLHVESEAGKGTKVTIQFTRAAAEFA
jgi:two-component sensor histidine kinase